MLSLVMNKERTWYLFKEKLICVVFSKKNTIKID